MYDASAKSSGPSLNDCLYTGPHRITLAGDIEKAFLMVSIAEEDANLQRFLWFHNVEIHQGRVWGVIQSVFAQRQMTLINL